jgi:cytochrome c6
MRTPIAPFLSVVVLIGVALFAAGCGGSANASGTVSGPITVADKATVPSGGSANGGGATTSGGATTGGGVTTSGGATSTAQGDPVAGKAVFTANCGACHTLKDAAATGTVGPDLDQLAPNFTTVQNQVTNGGAIMPAFKGKLSDADIANVAAYVSSVAGK